MTDETAIERWVRRAFLAATKYNRVRGYKPPEANIRRSRSGLRLVGPYNYRITMHVPAALFGELEQQRRRHPRYQGLSMSSFILHRLVQDNRAVRAAGRRAVRRAAA